MSAFFVSGYGNNRYKMVDILFCKDTLYLVHMCIATFRVCVYIYMHIYSCISLFMITVHAYAYIYIFIPSSDREVPPPQCYGSPGSTPLLAAFLRSRGPASYLLGFCSDSDYQPRIY